MTLHCAFVLACGLNVVIGVAGRVVKTVNKARLQIKRDQ